MLKPKKRLNVYIYRKNCNRSAHADFFYLRSNFL